MPIFSLPSKYGIGCFDESAYDFVDFLKKAGQTYWQILPLCPTGYGDSPYQSFSVFAGNPYFISVSALANEGLLKKSDCEVCDFGSNPEKVNYSRLYKHRLALLYKAYKSFCGNAEYDKFCADNKWLYDYSLFMAIKEKFGGEPISEWDEDIRLRTPSAMKRLHAELADRVKFHSFLQFRFFSDWSRLKAYANRSGVKIIGDIPIYVSADSADVWSHPELFQVDGALNPTSVAGCPPDSFSADGQLWGNPLYEWEKHKESGYAWWTERMKHCFKLYDTVRIDHFRGFDEYYSIPFGAKNARSGSWRKGAGTELFETIKAEIPNADIIAEDLGFVTDSVRKLVRDCGFPNMKVLQFGFDSRDDSGNEHLPHNYGENCVAYTGTHDNDTLMSWLDSITHSERKKLRTYLSDKYTPNHRLYKSLIALTMRSPAYLSIIPLQDWLGLHAEGRINTPSTAAGNWRWRAEKKQISDKLADKIRKQTEQFGRI